MTSLLGHPIYKAWQNMKQRCFNPKSTGYINYGDRGISIDPSWFDFSQFYADMHATWRPGLTLERIDTEDDYSKDNCKWATRREQVLNTRQRKDNTSGVTGVIKLRSRWQAYGRENGRQVHLYFGASFEAACAARKAWEIANGKTPR